MDERDHLMKSIMDLENSKGHQLEKFLEYEKNKDEALITKSKNNLQMIGHSLYWNYYNLNINSTKLNEKFLNLPHIKIERNRRRKNSWHHLGLAKMYLADIKLKKRIELAKMKRKRDKLFREIEAYKNKHFA
jgi:hypothetical protein